MSITRLIITQCFGFGYKRKTNIPSGPFAPKLMVWCITSEHWSSCKWYPRPQVWSFACEAEAQWVMIWDLTNPRDAPNYMLRSPGWWPSSLLHLMIAELKLRRDPGVSLPRGLWSGLRQPWENAMYEQPRFPTHVPDVLFSALDHCNAFWFKILPNNLCSFQKSAMFLTLNNSDQIYGLRVI